MFFVITDILNSNSEIIALGERASIIPKAFGKELENDKALLEGVVSRKKTNFAKYRQKYLIKNNPKINFLVFLRVINFFKSIEILVIKFIINKYN